MKNIQKQFGWFYGMPKSRPADYYLVYDDGSVFIDFNNFDEGRITLVRISFDGYGCCGVEDKSLVLMEEKDMTDFKNMFAKKEVDQKRMMEIVSKILSENKKDLWKDVLKEYQLI